MATGVGRTEVFSAADALVLEGARPTIERVRQKIGRGSPNTVSPLLDDWFKALGQRLAASHGHSGALESPASPAVPPSVLAASERLWRAAKAEAAASVNDERLEVLAARQGLVAQQEELEREKQRVAEVVGVLQAQVKQLSADLASARELAHSRESQLRELAEDARQARQSAEHASQALLDAMAGAAQERARLEERNAANERRLALELDRAREAHKALQAQLRAVSEAAEEAESQALLERSQLAERLLDSQRRGEEWSRNLLDARERAQALDARLAERATEVQALQAQLRAREAEAARLLALAAEASRARGPSLRRKLRPARG